jgi:hypothetical protein
LISAGATFETEGATLEMEGALMSVLGVFAGVEFPFGLTITSFVLGACFA